MRLILLPALPRLWRDKSTVQLGTDPQYAALLEFADPKFAGVLGLLDGTRTETQVARDAARFGISTIEVRRLVNLLRAAGLVIDQGALLPTEFPADARMRLRCEASALAVRHRAGERSPAGILRRRRGSAVLIRGHGRMVALVAGLLAASGVGRIEIDVHRTVTEEDVTLGGGAARRCGPVAGDRDRRGGTPGSPQREPTPAARHQA